MLKPRRSRRAATVAALLPLLVLALLTLALAPGRRARAEAPPPAAATTAGDVRQWLTDLSARLPARREAAHRQLIGLSRPGLQLLRDAVKQRAAELAPQEDLLHDVVVQAFLATEPYAFERVPLGDRLRVPGFMGVSFDMPDQNEDSPYEGVEIRHIIPGLCASKYLEEGDVVFDVRFGDGVWKPRTADEMVDVVGQFDKGQQITLTVLRRGRLLSVDMTLGGKPPHMPEAMLQFQAARQTEAEAYWDDHFAALFNPAPPRAAATPVRASADR